MVFCSCTITLKAAVDAMLLGENNVKLELNLLHCGLHKTSRRRRRDLGESFITGITFSGMKLNSEAFGNRSFTPSTSSKNYATSEFGRRERAIVTASASRKVPKMFNVTA